MELKKNKIILKTIQAHLLRLMLEMSLPNTNEIILEINPGSCARGIALSLMVLSAATALGIALSTQEGPLALSHVVYN